MTSASCTYNKQDSLLHKPTRNFYILAGDIYKTATCESVGFRVAEIHVHENYSFQLGAYDIALMKVIIN